MPSLRHKLATHPTVCPAQAGDHRVLIGQVQAICCLAECPPVPVTQDHSPLFPVGQCIHKTPDTEPRLTSGSGVQGIGFVADEDPGNSHVMPTPPLTLADIPLSPVTGNVFTKVAMGDDARHGPGVFADMVATDELDQLDYDALKKVFPVLPREVAAVTQPDRVRQPGVQCRVAKWVAALPPIGN